MDKRKVIIFGLLLILFWGCNNISDKKQKRDQDRFYTNTGGWDWIRIPLIKPYEITKIDPEIKANNWGMSFIYGLKNHGVSNIKEIAIADSIIYIHCGDSTLFNYQYIKEAWYIVILSQKIEKGFTNEVEFEKMIKENKYPEPRWLDVDSLSNVLSKGRKLPWFPK